MWMRKICGTLHECSDGGDDRKRKSWLSFGGKASGAGFSYGRVRIGTKVLKGVRDEDFGLEKHLNEEVCLYLFNIFLTPCLIGYKVTATGEKDLVDWEFIRNSSLQFAVIYALVYLFGTYLAVGFLWHFVAGGQSSVPGYAAFTMVGLIWLHALLLPVAFARAKLD
jgi:hypothetical protein